MKALLLAGLLTVALVAVAEPRGTVGKVGPDGTIEPMQCSCLPPIFGKVICICG